MAPAYERQRVARARRARSARAGGSARADGALERGPAGVDQVVADVARRSSCARRAGRGGLARSCAPPRAPTGARARAPRSPMRGAEPRDGLDRVAIAVARAEVHARIDAARVARAGSARRCSGVSTNSRQSIAPSRRRLPMLLLTETWLAACCWPSSCTSCSIVWPESARRCSIHVSGSASAAPWPCRRRANSATKALVSGGPERAMSAMTRIRSLGDFSATSSMRSAQRPARSRSTCATATRAPTRRRFSISASRSMIGKAHSSPSSSGCTDW